MMTIEEFNKGRLEYVRKMKYISFSHRLYNGFSLASNMINWFPGQSIQLCTVGALCAYSASAVKLTLEKQSTTDNPIITLKSCVHAEYLIG